MDSTHSSAIKVTDSLHELAKDLVGLGQETLIGAADVIEVLLKENSELKVRLIEIEREKVEEFEKWRKLEEKLRTENRELKSKILPPNNPGIRVAPPSDSKYFKDPRP